MTDVDDKFDRLDELLRSVNPIPGQKHSGVDLDVTRRMTERKIAARARRRRRLWALPTASIALVGITAAALALQPEEASEPETLNISCAAGLSGDTASQTIAHSLNPVLDCASLWRAGMIIAGTTAVPDLQACVRSGRPVVFPNRDACRTLGLAPFGGYSSMQSRAIGLDVAITSYLRGRSCEPREHTRTYVEQELARRGMLGWSIVFPPSSTPCTDHIVELETRTVTFLS